MKAYLDIETSFQGRITIFGLYRPDRGFFQLTGKEISPSLVLHLLRGSHTILSYNGSRFDLPVIKKELGIDLTKEFYSYDLMYDCWNFNLYGGLKAVEEILGIPRKFNGINGFDAMVLWARYETYHDEEALQSLLQYNKEDVLNLIILEKKLLRLYEIASFNFD